MKYAYFLFNLFFLWVTISGLQASLEAENPQKVALSQPGVNLIAKFEGFRSTIYSCPGGKPTIGFGHVIKTGENFTSELSREDALELLKKDVVQTYVPDIQSLVKCSLTQNEFDALVSFDYNLGASNLSKSTLLSDLNDGKKSAASLQFPLWANAAGKYLPGLAKRRFAEMLIFRNDSTIPLEELKFIPTKTGNLLGRYQDLSEPLKQEIQSIYTRYSKELLNS